ncbi:Domain of uncharacterised function (DUF2825) [Salmonella enterica subsp. enterica]|uniref:Domain of uncharacterized function (DUF2825) n=1 Tax=Salmonella enterica I TaxID=59201 RepID=A0A379UV94_SALET|nr:Domain of uncharacterised function (DUF2825) [Salmonella enterica subsp. enterica]
MCDGLSPLARGTLAIMYDELPKYRFIPAGAGNTAPWLIHRLAAPVYPRWRGEHTKTLKAIPLAYGLSPLARGALTDNAAS